MYKDTVKQILEDIADLTDDMLADEEIEYDLKAEVVYSLDESSSSLEDALRRLKN